MEKELKRVGQVELREYKDSFGIGSAVKGGALKVYFDIDEEAKKKFDDSKVAKLLKLRTALQGLRIDI